MLPLPKEADRVREELTPVEVAVLSYGKGIHIAASPGPGSRPTAPTSKGRSGGILIPNKAFPQSTFVAVGPCS